MSNNIPAKGTKDKYEEIIMKMFNPHNEVIEVDDKKERPVDEASRKWKMNDQILELFTDNIERDQDLKEKYAIILIIILAIQLLALITIFVLKGYGILVYSDSSFNLFITGGIAEVFVLVRVIVKYLFKDNLTNALNIILENNNKVKSNEKYENNKNQKNWKVLFLFDKFQHFGFT